MLPLDRISFSIPDLSFTVATDKGRDTHRNCASEHYLYTSLCVEILRLAGWQVEQSVDSTIARRPLRRVGASGLLGSEGVDERARGFRARRAGAEAWVECSAGETPLIYCVSGDVSEVAEAIGHYLSSPHPRQ